MVKKFVLDLYIDFEARRWQRRLIRQWMRDLRWWRMVRNAEIVD
jgi:hypothetical protein